MPNDPAINCGKSSADSEASLKRCIECAYNIPEEASKCKECGAFQDKRRYLSVSSTTLSLMIALITVATLAAQVINRISESADADIRIFVTKSEIIPMSEELFREIGGLTHVGGELKYPIEGPVIRIEFLAVNDGKKTGIVRLVQVDAARDGDDDPASESPLELSSHSFRHTGAVPVRPGTVARFQGFRRIPKRQALSAEPNVGYSVILSNGTFVWRESRQPAYWRDSYSDFLDSQGAPPPKSSSKDAARSAFSQEH